MNSEQQWLPAQKLHKNQINQYLSMAWEGLQEPRPLTVELRQLMAFEGGRDVFFTDVVPGRLITLLWVDPHLWVNGQIKLESIDVLVTFLLM